MSDKRIVDVECSDILYDYYDLFNRKTPDEVIEAMNEFKANHPNREELYFILQVNAHDHGVDVIVKERRLETDKEYQDRLKQEALANDKIKTVKAKELAECKRLKAIYENVSDEEAVDALAEKQGWFKNITSLIPVPDKEAVTVKKKDGSFSNGCAYVFNWSNESSSNYITHYRKSGCFT